MKSNCNLRRAPALTARTEGTFPRKALSLRTQQPSSARHKWDKRWIFSLRPLPHHKLKPLAQRTENQGIPPRTYMKRMKEKRSSSARMKAEIKDLSHLFCLSYTTGALFEEPCHGVHAPSLDCCHTWPCKSLMIKQQGTTLLRLQTCLVSPLDQHTITTSQAFSWRKPWHQLTPATWNCTFQHAPLDN